MMESIKEKYLEKLSEDFQLISELVLKQLNITIGILEGDRREASYEEVEKNESLIDSLDVKIRDEVINSIVLFTPRAIDLRKTVAYLDMTFYLERIGDLIQHISDFTKDVSLEERGFAAFKPILNNMFKLADKMVSNSVYSFAGEDETMATKTITIDDKVDKLQMEIRSLLKETFKGKKVSEQDLINIIGIASVSNNIERIADHATSIAQSAIYLIKGKDIRHKEKTD